MPVHTRIGIGKRVRVVAVISQSKQLPIKAKLATIHQSNTQQKYALPISITLLALTNFQNLFQRVHVKIIKTFRDVRNHIAQLGRATFLLLLLFRRFLCLGLRLRLLGLLLPLRRRSLHVHRLHRGSRLSRHPSSLSFDQSLSVARAFSLSCRLQQNTRVVTAATALYNAPEKSSEISIYFPRKVPIMDQVARAPSQKPIETP